MTSADFLAFYPQFEGPIPAPVLESYVTLANARFEDFLEDAEEARRLFIAHKLTLWAKTSPAALDATGSSGSVTLSSLSSAGDVARINGKKVENISVTYSSGSSRASSSSLEDLPETLYGIQLLALLRRFARPWYVPG